MGGLNRPPQKLKGMKKNKMSIEEENKYLKEKIKRLEKEKEMLKAELKKQKESSAWDFHWDGCGNYEQSRASFYGDFG